MGRMVYLMFVFVMVGGIAQAEEATPDTERETKIEDFVGHWQGKWDDTWRVRFTMGYNEKTKRVLVLYEWEEELGAPLRRRWYFAKFRDEAVLFDAIELTIAEGKPKKGTAIGNWQRPRTSDMVWSPGPPDFLDIKLRLTAPAVVEKEFENEPLNKILLQLFPENGIGFAIDKPAFAARGVPDLLQLKASLYRPAEGATIEEVYRELFAQVGAAIRPNGDHIAISPATEQATVPPK